MMVKEFKVNKSTMIFKINIVKLIDKYPKLMKSSFVLKFFENLFKRHLTCNENCSESK